MTDEARWRAMARRHAGPDAEPDVVEEIVEHARELYRERLDAGLPDDEAIASVEAELRNVPRLRRGRRQAAGRPPLAGTGGAQQHAQARVRRTSAAGHRPDRRGQRLLDVDAQMAALDPGHDDSRQARAASLRIALVATDVGASGQVPRIGARQQPLEGLERYRIQNIDGNHMATQGLSLLRGRGIALHHLCAMADGVRHLVADVLAFPGDLLDRV